ncbi:hypothetical protein K402DRAFT_390364, partial [Aulographum hederae CBS 113979]
MGRRMIKSHRKTRTGCSQCKARRVKCDERKPSCSNCLRLCKPCSLLTTTPGPLPTSWAQPNKWCRSSLVDASAAASTALTNASDLALDRSDLELLHHYATSTSGTVADSKGVSIYRDKIPKMATEYPFLLHGILAISAIHLASLNRHRRHSLLRKACLHEDLALPSFRQLTSTVTARNCDALFSFSGLVTFYVQATSSPYDEQFPPLWFNLLRGTHTLLYSNWGLLSQGAFRAILKRTQQPIELVNNPEDRRLAALTLFVSAETPSTKADHDMLTLCNDAIIELRRVFSLPYSPCKTVDMRTAAHIWPGTISSAFMTLLQKRIPQALIVFAHYCILLHRCSRGSWFLEPVAANLVNFIRLSLDEKWQHGLEWPLEEVGLVEKPHNEGKGIFASALI